MPKTMNYHTTLTTLDCGMCAIPFAIPSDLYQGATQDGRWFWCPNGHRIHFYETENQKLQDELARAKTGLIRERQDREAAERSNAALRGVVTRTKKRVGKGVCPCCNRHFANVQRHMEGQHPDYIDADPEQRES